MSMTMTMTLTNHVNVVIFWFYITDFFFPRRSESSHFHVKFQFSADYANLSDLKHLIMELELFVLRSLPTQAVL